MVSKSVSWLWYGSIVLWAIAVGGNWVWENVHKNYINFQLNYVKYKGNKYSKKTNPESMGH